MSRRPCNLRELKESGWASQSVKDEMRANILAMLKDGKPLFEGIVGYDRSVIPAIENAILSGHDMIFLGERGQAKTRIIRSLTNFLDEWIPFISGCEIDDDPLAPVCRDCRDRIEREGDDLPIEWLHRSQRYGEKLATPDVSIGDLIGEIDPVKIAEGRYLADERAIHFGLVPRTNRGIFAINELPDLAEKVQVGLFNIMEERDFQIKGFKVLLRLDVVIVASANPEDYTHRGRIITPLKDRFASLIRTHYPENRELEIAIMEQERRAVGGFVEVRTPQFIKDIVAQITIEARSSPEINQRSGVSVRMTIANYENIVSNAVKRALLLGEPYAVPRISDLLALYPSSRGKIELEYAGEDRDESEVVQLLVQRAIKHVFDQIFTVEEFSAFEDIFNAGAIMEVSAAMPSEDYMDVYAEVPELRAAAEKLGCTEQSTGVGATYMSPLLASAAEFILDGLHLHKHLNKKELELKQVYQGKAQNSRIV